MLEVCEESRSVGRALSALTAGCPTVISVAVHPVSGAVTFTAWASAAHMHELWFEMGFLDG